jgi:nardilysin
MGKILKTFVDPKTYDYLRSKYQLGYVVGCGIDQTSEVLSFYLVVLSQEHKHKFNVVQEKMDDFIDNTIKTAIDELKDEDFDNLREATIKELQAEVLTLDGEVNQNYNEISEEFYLFDRKELLEIIAQRLTKSEFQEFFHSFIDLDKQRVLCTHSIGNEKPEGEQEANVENVNEVNVEFITDKLGDERVITNIEEFQKDLYLYPSVVSHV